MEQVEAGSDGVWRWNEPQQLYRDALRTFVESEVVPRRADLELADLPPYDVLRRFYTAFGVGNAALERFEARLAHGADVARQSAAETILPMIELSRCSPGMVTALGVSVSLAAGAIIRAGTPEQQRRWVPDLLTLRTVGAWAITEPDSGSDAFGGMRTTARADADGWVLTGRKTFITNGPYADTVVVICHEHSDLPRRQRSVLTFVLDRGMEGLEQTKPLRKMGLHSSPTGEIGLHGVRVGRDRLLAGAGGGAGGGDARDRARSAFATERASVAAMALGIIESCLDQSISYAANRVQFDRPISDFQLVQLKLANMEIARLNVENLVLRYVADVDSGHRPTLTTASAMKLYAARSAIEVALEAVQVQGGSGYMAESHVEQLCRDAKVLQIYGGTDEIQVTHIARGLLQAHGQSRPG
jgi:alkylation response protein AidB-like acyl-CoA dehydrogenase